MGIVLEISAYHPDQDESEIVSLERVLTEVAGERHRQDRKWGGADHDDGHTVDDWRDILDRLKLELHIAAERSDLPQIRHHLIEISAAAAAAVQSIDRLNPGMVDEVLDQVDAELDALEDETETAGQGIDLRNVKTVGRA